MSAADRGALLDRGHAQLSVRRQCTLLGLAGSRREMTVHALNLEIVALPTL